MPLPAWAAVAVASALALSGPVQAQNYPITPNQRAIAEFHLGLFQASAEDCKRVLERNPHHIGALSGLAKCLLRLDRREEALEVLRRSSRMQPFNEDLRILIAALEAGES